MVLAAHGYPDKPRSGDVISGLDAVASLEGVRVLHAGTARKDGAVVTSGGRVLGVCAAAGSVGAAYERAYAAVERIRFDGMQFRRDIAGRALGQASG